METHGLSSIQYVVVRVMRNGCNTVHSIDFESFGADRKAVVHVGSGGHDALFWVRPGEDEETVIVSVKSVDSRKPRAHPRTRLRAAVPPNEAPSSMNELMERVLQARGEISREDIG